MSASTQRADRVLLGLFVLLFTFSAAHGEDYQIKLIRTEKVGDQYLSSITAKYSETTVEFQNGEETDRNTSSFTAACQGSVKVQAIDAKTGVATRFRYEVEKMTKDGKELFVPGTVIICKKDGSETNFEIEGGRPEEEQATVLNALLGDGRSNAIMSETASGGTDKPQQVGGTWPVNTSKVATGLYEPDGKQITTDAVKGESQLVSIKQLDGKDVMVVKSTLTADGFKVDLDDGWSLSDGKIKSEVTETLPVDATQPALSSIAKLTVKVSMNPPRGAHKTVLTLKAERRSRRDPVDQ